KGNLPGPSLRAGPGVPALALARPDQHSRLLPRAALFDLDLALVDPIPYGAELHAAVGGELPRRHRHLAAVRALRGRRGERGHGRRCVVVGAATLLGP